MKFIKEKDDEQIEEKKTKRRKAFVISAIILMLLIGVSVFFTVSFYKDGINSESKNAMVDSEEVPVLRFGAYSNCYDSTNMKFKYINNGRGLRGHIGIRSAYWKKNFVIELTVSSKYQNQKSLKTSDIIVGNKLSVVSVNFVSNSKEKGLYVSKYRITLKSKLAVSLNGLFTNIKIKKNTFRNKKGYMSKEFEIPIFLSPYD